MEGRLALAKGDWTIARDLLEKAIAAFETCGYAPEEMRTRRSLAEAHLKAGDREAAETELRKVVQMADDRVSTLESNEARRQLAEMGLEAIPLSPQGRGSGRGAPEEESPLSPQGIGQASPLSPQGRGSGRGAPEERVVTVMFADVRGYTQMVTNEAPADLVDKVAAFHRWAKQEVERHHGVVDKFAGDAVMATFNVSGAKLDHTLQALQAALAIRDKAKAAGLPVGIGIAVGPAVVGSLTADSNMSAIGEVTNLASRLQSQASAGDLVLSEEAYKRTGRWLDEQSMPTTEEELTLKGFVDRVSVHRLSDRSIQT
jgi:class 3 adenylate cyclase